MSGSYSGSTQECLLHLGELLESYTEDYYDRRDTFAEFVQASPDTVYRWLKGERPPAGERLLRVRSYLRFLGYQVAELESMDSRISQATDIFSFGIMSLDEIASMVGYGSNRDSNDGLMAVLRGARNTSEEKLESFQSALDLYEEQLRLKQANTQKVVTLDEPMGLSEAVVAPVSLPTAHRTVSDFTVDEHALVMETLAAQATLMIPLVRALESDAFSPQDRAKVREMVGERAFFGLANGMYRLCGERSRRMRS